MSIQLTKLCHDVVQNSYKDLHALLDSLGDDAIPTRHERLAEHILTERHRYARLLVAVSGIARGAAAHASAVQEAAEILGSASYIHRIPGFIESSVGVDTLGKAFDTSSDDSSEDSTPYTKSPDRMDFENAGTVYDEKKQCKPVADLSKLESEAVDRLRSATADLASRALPNGVKLLKLGVEPAGAAVRVGVPGAWTADVVLDRLLVAEAFFVLLRFNIMVDSSPDAVNDIKSGNHASERALPLTREQKEPLRQMLEDRMRWAAISASGADVVERAKRVLHCLCEAMSNECCGKLALHHIRAQCRALVSRGIWNAQDFSVIEPGAGRDPMSPIHVRYWLRSSMTDRVEISISSASSSANAPAHIVNVVSVQDAFSRSNGQLVNPASLDVERLLLDICRERALGVMRDLVQECSAILPNSASLKVANSSKSVVSVILVLSGEAPELIFGISLRTGGVLARWGGTLSRSPSRSSHYVKALNEVLWEGERFFSKSVPSLREALKGIIEKAVTAYIDASREIKVLREKAKKSRIPATPGSPRVQSNRNSSANDLMKKNIPDNVGSPHRFPPIKVSGKRGREPADKAQDGPARKLARTGVTSRAARSLCAGRTATSLACADEAVHSQAIEKLRDILTSEMQAMKVMTASSPNAASARSGKYQVPVKTMPMETESSTMHIRGCDGWALRVVLRRNIFDTVPRGGVVSYVRNTKTLRFTYPGISKRTVQCFRKDLIRARTAAALITGLSANPGKFRIRRRRPTHVLVEVGNMTLSAGLGRRSVEVETYPRRPIITAQLIPLIEEMLNDAGMEMGQRFGELLDRSLPIGQAIQSVLPKDPKKFRIRFLNALRARYVIAHLSGRKQMTYAIDIDARAGRDRVMLIDVARAQKVTSNNTSASQAQQFSPIPTWEMVLNKLAAKGRGRPVHEGAAVQIPTSLLPAVLSVTVGTYR